MTARWITADVFDGLATLENGSVDLIVTSPPFLALRSYLPADHPDKSKEIGSEATPAEFIDTLLAVTAELRRVLAPHGSICVELGDTYAGSSQEQREDVMIGSARWGGENGQPTLTGARGGTVDRKGNGWPLAKSRALIPQLYEIALAYGINPLTGQPSPAGQWRVRNVVTWARPNPPVGALGDKWRPATSDLIVACTSSKRYWDDLATRRPLAAKTLTVSNGLQPSAKNSESPTASHRMDRLNDEERGAPLLDYWEIPPGGYSGKALTIHREPCGPHDGGQRTTSPDCPAHGDRADQAPTAPDDERADTSLSHTSRTDTDPVQGRLVDSVPTDPNSERSTVLSNSGSPDRGRSLAAKPRSKASSKTAPAPGTNAPDTPSEETTPRTAGRPASPEFGEHRPGTSESNISASGSGDNPESQTAGGTPDIQTSEALSEACTCSYFKVVKEEYTSHYAVFPPELVVPCVKAMCPEKVCRVCGEPSRRIVETSYERLSDGQPLDEMDDWRTGRGGIEKGLSNGKTPARSIVDTLGFTDCGHHCKNCGGSGTDPAYRIARPPCPTCNGNPTYRPGIVLDPFAGSGTTLAVATGHGHDAIGIDLDPRNADLARDRIGPFLFEEMAK